MIIRKQRALSICTVACSGGALFGSTSKRCKLAILHRTAISNLGLEISFSPQPSSALKIQDGGQTFREGSLSVRSPKIHLHCRLFVRKTWFSGGKSNGTAFSTGNYPEKKNTFRLQMYSCFLVFAGIIGKSLYHLFRPTSTMLLDKIRGLCQASLLIQIVEPRLSQKNSQLCVKGTRSSRSIYCIVPFDGEFSPVFPYK